MEIIKKHGIIIGIGFVGALLAGFLWTQQAEAPKALPVETDVVASSTPSVTEVVEQTKGENTVATTPVFAINAKDTIASWSFKGQYVGNAVLTKQATDDIAALIKLRGTGKYDDYDVYNGLGNDYNMIGEGKLAYDNYNKAIAIHPAKGLTYVNLGLLMEHLGAYQSAADAYKKAVTVEAGMINYHVARLTFLTKNVGADTALIDAAFTDAEKQFGDTVQTLSIKAEWLTAQKRYAEAIKIWQTVKTLSSGSDTGAIDAAITRLQNK